MKVLVSREKGVRVEETKIGRNSIKVKAKFLFFFIVFQTENMKILNDDEYEEEEEDKENGEFYYEN